MSQLMLGRKLGMTHSFDDQGRMIPVTVIACDTNMIVRQKTSEKDGYEAFILATQGSKHVSKPIQQSLKKQGIEAPLGIMREFRAHPDEQAKLTPGSEITTGIFKPGDSVTLSAVSKGKGFAGTVKRHGFSRGPKTHGSNNYRQPGAIGSQEPQRVIKGKKMSGHMGFKRITIKKAEVVTIDQSKGFIVVKGSVPGPNRGLVEVRKI